MNTAEIKPLIKQELPSLIKEDKELQRFILDLAQAQFADKQETESRFDRILNDLQRDREESSKRWEENSNQWREEIKKIWQKHESTDEAIKQLGFPEI